jgi:hypothetical protein
MYLTSFLNLASPVLEIIIRIFLGGAVLIGYFFLAQKIMTFKAGKNGFFNKFRNCFLPTIFFTLLTVGALIASFFITTDLAAVNRIAIHLAGLVMALWIFSGICYIAKKLHLERKETKMDFNKESLKDLKNQGRLIPDKDFSTENFSFQEATITDIISEYGYNDICMKYPKSWSTTFRCSQKEMQHMSEKIGSPVGKKITIIINKVNKTVGIII